MYQKLQTQGHNEDTCGVGVIKIGTHNIVMDKEISQKIYVLHQVFERTGHQCIAHGSGR